MTYGNGLVASYAYEADGALDSTTHDFTGTDDDVTYAFDYNLANQITREDVSNGDYIYNASVTPDSDYIVNALNQYTSITQGGVPYTPTYDDNGSLTSDGVWTFTYLAVEENPTYLDFIC